MADMSIQKLYQAALTEGLRDCCISGWMRTVRDSKAFEFMEINDGTYFKNLQIVLEDGATQDFSEVVKTTLGSAIRAWGELVLTQGMK